MSALIFSLFLLLFSLMPSAQASVGSVEQFFTVTLIDGQTLDVMPQGSRHNHWRRYRRSTGRRPSGLGKIRRSDLHER